VSQRDDILTQLREAQQMAPSELREHVRQIAAGAAPARRRLSWRRALLVAVPVALSLVLVPLELALWGDAVFHAGGPDSGSGGRILEAVEIGLLAW